MSTEMKEFMVDLAQKAGSVLMNNFKIDKELLNVRSTAKEVVTKYDKEVDQLIIKQIRKTYPSHSLLTEESGHHVADPDWLWIVDSLDGTGNFANQNPFFSVCLALMHKGELYLGVIYAPAINEFYLAERGKGAYLNQKRIHVSNIKKQEKSYLFYCEGGNKDRIRTGAILNEIYPKAIDIRKLGSAGLETAWVAAGRGEAYFTTKIEPWDVAPGVLLVSEAGGQVTDFRGNPWKSECGDFLFSNGEIHSTLLELLHDA
jgi:myo-inositol-1(or 4)-monophosphatase